MARQPEISVVIPAYNRAHCIGDAVRSALDQRGVSLEIVVVDDGSRDDLAGALAPFGAAVRLVRHETNRGASAARNTGIAAASGRRVALLDSDDLWKPDKLIRQLRFMDAHGFAMACTGFSIAEGVDAPAVAARRSYDRALGIEDFVWGCYVSPGTTMVAERALLPDLGGYDPAFPRLEDWDLLLRVAMAGIQVGWLEEDLATIRVGGRPPLEPMRQSVTLMRARHLAALGRRDRKLQRQFRAALRFTLASAQWYGGDRLGFVSSLLQALLLAPAGNRAVATVLGGKVATGARCRPVGTGSGSRRDKTTAS